MSETSYKVGHLLRSDIRGFVVGSPIVDQETPTFGGLVKAPLGKEDLIYGLVTNIEILDDGLVRQLVTGAELDETVRADNRVNRTVPMEISVLAVGHKRAGATLTHGLPPRAPLSLDAIHECSDEELIEFTSAGFGYLRHVLGNPDLPVNELIAAHVRQASEAHGEESNWRERAAEEIVMLLKDDYAALMDTLRAIAEGQPAAGAGR